VDGIDMGKLKDMLTRRKKDEKATEYQENVVLAEQNRPGPSEEDYSKWLGRSVHSIRDQELVNLLILNDLEHLIPLVSHLNRLTKITEKDVELDRLNIEYIFLREECLMLEDNYQSGTAGLIKSLKFFADHIPTDSKDGFKAELLAYQMKIIRTELQEKRK